MAKKPSKTAITSGRTGRTGKALVVQDPAASLVPAIVPAGGRVVRDGGTVLVAGRPYDAHGATIPAMEVYHVDDVKPKGDGPWLGEADKISWRDPATGYECIILRSHPGGFLCGFVGVPSSHPLHGFKPEAIPADLGIEVHGGLTYGRICQGGPSSNRRIVLQARTICHTVRLPTAFGSDHRIADEHAWWLGFECDHVADVVPDSAAHARAGAAAGVAQVYRDDAYVYREVTELAAQLHAVEQGRPLPPRSGPPLPPASLDPGRRQ